MQRRGLRFRAPGRRARSASRRGRRAACRMPRGARVVQRLRSRPARIMPAEPTTMSKRVRCAISISVAMPRPRCADQARAGAARTRSRSRRSTCCRTCPSGAGSGTGCACRRAASAAGRSRSRRSGKRASVKKASLIGAEQNHLCPSSRYSSPPRRRGGRLHRAQVASRPASPSSPCRWSRRVFCASGSGPRIVGVGEDLRLPFARERRCVAQHGNAREGHRDRAGRAVLDLVPEVVQHGARRERRPSSRSRRANARLRRSRAHISSWYAGWKSTASMRLPKRSWVFNSGVNRLASAASCWPCSLPTNSPSEVASRVTDAKPSRETIPPSQRSEVKAL